jgi:hypothetical protein
VCIYINNRLLLLVVVVVVVVVVALGSASLLYLFEEFTLYVPTLILFLLNFLVSHTLKISARRNKL